MFRSIRRIYSKPIVGVLGISLLVLLLSGLPSILGQSSSPLSLQAAQNAPDQVSTGTYVVVTQSTLTVTSPGVTGTSTGASTLTTTTTHMITSTVTSSGGTATTSTGTSTLTTTTTRISTVTSPSITTSTVTSSPGVTGTTSTGTSTSTQEINPGTASYATGTGHLFAMPFTPSVNMIVTKVGLKVANPAGNLLVAVYNSNSGKPNAPLATSASTAMTTGWNDIALNTPVSLTTSTQYWLCYQNTANFTVYFGNGPAYYYVANTYGTFPNPYPAGGIYGNPFPRDMRATYVQSAGTQGLTSTVTPLGLPTSLTTTITKTTTTTQAITTPTTSAQVTVTQLAPSQNLTATVTQTATGPVITTITSVTVTASPQATTVTAPSQPTTVTATVTQAATNSTSSGSSRHASATFNLLSVMGLLIGFPLLLARPLSSRCAKLMVRFLHSNEGA